MDDGEAARAADVTIAAVVALAYLMNYSGATATLGLAFAATGVLFPFFSSLLGWLGVFLTGSDTSANALFGTLAGGDGGPAGIEPGADGGGEFERRRDGQDDQPAEHRRGGRGHGDGAGGRRQAVPVHAAPFDFHGGGGGAITLFYAYVMPGWVK